MTVDTRRCRTAQLVDQTRGDVVRVCTLLWTTIVAISVIVGTVNHGLAVEPHRSWSELVSSNGFTGVVVSLDSGKVHHFREHLYSAEEPQWNGAGDEVWNPTQGGASCYKPESVWSRDLLYDAYFGYDIGDQHGWLPDVTVDRDASGYDGTPDRVGRNGGTGVVRLVQPLAEADLVFTTRVFAPWCAERAAFVMLLEIENVGEQASAAGRVYGLVNTHLGDDRPGPRLETNTRGESIGIEDTQQAIVEYGFPGAGSIRPAPPARLTHSPTPFYSQVRDVGGDLAAPAETPVVQDDGAGAVQWDVPPIEPGESTWVGLEIVFSAGATDGDGLVDLDEGCGFRAGDAADVLASELEGWSAFQDRVVVPTGLTDPEEDLFRHSAAILRMAQVRENSAFEATELVPGTDRYVWHDGEVLSAENDVRNHRGFGALLASLPPGEWAYAWVRDGAYAIVGLTDGGLFEEARNGLIFFLEAEAGRYADYDELEGIPLEDYALSLTRYFGFGLEESDTLCDGDFNFEFDGYGLFLWALRHYLEETGDSAGFSEYWPTLRDRVAGIAEGLVSSENGLLRADSSIWEVHWEGKEKQFAYTSIAAARGLCDAAWIANQMGDDDSAARFESAGRDLIRSIFTSLRDSNGAIASNPSELAAGTGYWDAAVIEAINFGLFDPAGQTARATFDGLRANLSTGVGPGWARNDDEHDAHDLTPYGGSYDSIEWVFIDLRASLAARHMGHNEFADEVQNWVRDQSLHNYLLIAENYDTSTGDYRNNVPMIGFGAGSYITAMRQRAGGWSPNPACGSYLHEVIEPGEPEPADVGETVEELENDAEPEDDMDAGTTDQVVEDVDSPEPDSEGPSDDSTSAEGATEGQNPSARGEGSGCSVGSQGGGLALMVLFSMMWILRRKLSPTKSWGE